MIPIIILTGGLGTRLKSTFPDTPKYLVPINKKPFAWHQLNLLKKLGFQKITLCVGYRSEAIIDFIGKGEQFGLSISYSHDGDTPLGTGGAIKKAMHLIDSPCGVLYGDSYLEFEFQPVLDVFYKSQKQALMMVYRNNNQFGNSNIEIVNQMISKYDKNILTPTMRYIDFGFSLYTKNCFLERNETSFDLSLVVNTLIQKKQLAAYEIHQRFYEAGTMDSKKELENYLQARD